MCSIQPHTILHIGYRVHYVLAVAVSVFNFITVCKALRAKPVTAVFSINQQALRIACIATKRQLIMLHLARAIYICIYLHTAIDC